MLGRTRRRVRQPQPVESERIQQGAGKDHVPGPVDMYSIRCKVVWREPCEHTVKGCLSIHEDSLMVRRSLPD